MPLMSTEAPPQNVIHLNRYHHFTQLMRDPSIEGELLRYESKYDGTTQSLLILRPAGRASDKIFFFFHGMDGDSGDGVAVRDLVTRLDATVIAPGGRGPAWVSDAFFADAEQVIRTYCAPSESFYLIGVSMGGTQALALAGLLPEDLRRRIVGVVAMIPGTDLSLILDGSSNERVKNTIRASVNNDDAALSSRSPAQVIEQYRPGLPFVIFYNREDTILLAEEMERFIERLRSARHPVATFSSSGNHCFTYPNFDYREALTRLGSDSSEEAVPLIED